MCEKEQNLIWSHPGLAWFSQKMSLDKITSLKTIALCKKTYLLMSSQGQPPSPSPIIMHKHFRDPPVHSTWLKFGLYFVYIFIADWNFLTKFCSSDPSFNGNILTSLYLKSETSAHAQLCDYSFIHTIYKFHSMMLAGNSHWGYLLINGVYS